LGGDAQRMGDCGRSAKRATHVDDRGLADPTDRPTPNTEHQGREFNRRRAEASVLANGRTLFKGRRMTDVSEHKTDPILTRQEVAERLRISVRTLSRLEANGKLPPRIQISDRVFGYGRTRRA
jgi:hypothetical protein